MKEPLGEHGVSRTAPQEILTVHGGGFAPVSRLALIEDDRVWCLDLDTYEPVRCRFTADSGSWAQTPTRRYALAGQAIDRDGQPGGPFVVAASVGTDGTVAGVDVSTLRDASGLDNAVGFSAQLPLGFGHGVLEMLNAATNVTGQPMRNYATRTVCAGSDPHPDGAAGRHAVAGRVLLPGSRCRTQRHQRLGTRRVRHLPAGRALRAPPPGWGVRDPGRQASGDRRLPTRRPPAQPDPSGAPSTRG